MTKDQSYWENIFQLMERRQLALAHWIPELYERVNQSIERNEASN